MLITTTANIIRLPLPHHQTLRLAQIPPQHPRRLRLPLHPPHHIPLPGAIPAQTPRLHLLRLRRHIRAPPRCPRRYRTAHPPHPRVQSARQPAVYAVYNLSPSARRVRTPTRLGSRETGGRAFEYGAREPSVLVFNASAGEFGDGRDLSGGEGGGG